MKNLLVVLIGLLVFTGCSKNDDRKEYPQNLLMEMFDISPNDTAGLKVFGFAHIKKDTKNIVNDTIALLGNKNGKLWIHILSTGKDFDVYENCKRVNSFIIDDKFDEEFRIDLGYGQEKVIKLDYIRWDGFAVEMNYMLIFHDQENFAISTNKTGELYPSWIIYNNTINPSKIRYYGIIASGYWGSDVENVYYRSYVCDEKGEPLYKYYHDGWGNAIFVNLYEFINYNYPYISRENAATGEIVWKTQFETMGEIIDGHEPKIEHSMEIKDDVVSCTFNITNYDGSKETKIINVDIETGEIINL